MKTSESLRKLVDALAPTVGNRTVKKLLLEHVEKVEDLEDQVCDKDREINDLQEEVEARSDY